MISETPRSCETLYSNQLTLIGWNAGCVVFALIGVFASVNDWRLTGAFALLMLLVWGGVWWLLSKNQYFISPTHFGCRDVFRIREACFTEVVSAEKVVGRLHMFLRVTCRERIVQIPMGPGNEEWFDAVADQLQKQSINVPMRAFGKTV